MYFKVIIVLLCDLVPLLLVIVFDLNQAMFGFPFTKFLHEAGTYETLKFLATLQDV